MVPVASWGRGGGTENQESNLLSILKPKSFLIEEPMFTNLSSEKFRIKSRWYSQQKSIELFESYSAKNKINYDFVLISRFDCCFYSFIDLKKIQKNYLYLSKWNFPHYITGHLDYWFLGDPKVIISIKNIYSFLENDFFKNNIFSNHKILKIYLSKKSVKVKKILKEHNDFKLTSRQYSKRTWYIKIHEIIVFIKELLNGRK